MKFDSLCRICRLAAIGAILSVSASCIRINEELGENFIPTDQQWDVFNPEAVELEDIRLQMSDSLAGYGMSRFTFGAINDGELGTTVKGTSFTLVPLNDTIDFGKNTKIRRFHLSAVRDTFSTMYDSQERIIQNIYVSELKKPLDSTVLYTGSFSQYTEKGRENFNNYINDPYDAANRITDGVPVYSGGDSLSFDFSLEFAERFAEKLAEADLDSMDLYVNSLPGIFITTDRPVGEGGRINMFEIGLATTSTYTITGNFAELQFTAEYDYSDEPVDTSFLFMFGAADFMKLDDNGSLVRPTQLAFNASDHETALDYSKDGIKATDKIFVEGGSGVKPVIKAERIKQILEKMCDDNNIGNPEDVVINKATIILPYDVGTSYEKLDKYPMILSPTVRLRSSDDKYISYAGLTDSSIASENQGNINRSTSRYAPDISHHVQEILKLDRSDSEYAKKIENYDIWFLIMHEEITVTDTGSNYNDYYNNLLYSSYYNNMMYDPYGYGYGYGGYGYGGYGYGYDSYGYGYGSNYYNYLMMAQYASMSNTTNTSSSVELDKDRFYNAVLNGPESSGERPRLKVTFSVPKSAE